MAHLLLIPPCPKEAPEWFSQAYSAISTQCLGTGFNALLEGFIALERAYDFKNPRGKGFAATMRPEEIGAWIGVGRGRRGGWAASGLSLTTTKAAEFGERWWKWWKRLQPPFRKLENVETHYWPRAAGRRSTASAADWASLYAPGTNGMFLVVLGLFWWGRGLGVGSRGTEKSTAEREWTEAVHDVCWIMEGLVEQKAAQDSQKADTELESDQLGGSD
ncbi:hypothetical protein B0H15DRAFT_794790 [Mycena belliarum]|uniref:Uncharacterized protein n=1 Tax=Mycena belliarum TaxID=1033014 RepID=A0AAD6TL72_9AGAR|nr:hypothetical protein B0H15DRAFT_794790 [Mycena belliae]